MTSLMCTGIKAESKESNAGCHCSVKSQHLLCCRSHQASEDSEGHGSQQEQHQNQIQGAPDKLHALGVLSLWRQVSIMFSGFGCSRSVQRLYERRRRLFSFLHLIHVIIIQIQDVLQQKKCD